ncbi:protein INSYN2B isoform X2 [Amblyraja radiata]|uniref:protein INSYN2B isoform X2 n=1 Tax=Amblyraja radiata TaxID=386614 RepID=UPI0014021398|nr:protein INSYN2B isoform X2 [Amblyraja radiata]
MGRKESNCLQASRCHSAPLQDSKVRSLELKQGQTSGDPTNQVQESKGKVQQVHFKEEQASNMREKTEGKPAPKGKAQRPRPQGLASCSLVIPKRQGVLKSIAIQTSPSLRKHLPRFKGKLRNSSKSAKGSMLMESVKDAGATATGKGLALDVTNAATQVERTEPSLTQVKGAVRGSSEPSTCSMVRRKPSSKSPEPKLPETQCEGSASCHCPDISAEAHNSGKLMVLDHPSDPGYPHSNAGDSLTESTPSGNGSHPNCSGLHKLESVSAQPSIAAEPGGEGQCKDKVWPECSDCPPECVGKSEQVGRDVPKSTSCTLNEDKAGISGTDPASDNVPNHTASCNMEIKAETSKRIKEINQIHLTQGDLFDLQGRMQFIEDTLQSNEHQIKVLLNVIQDMEKTKALNEGRNFYRTGQDLSNCSTCQNTACIIYSVEYDFRQQEGRFHHVLRALEIEDEGTQHQDLTRGSADDQTSQKQELKNKARKPKKTCFWCL